MVNIGGLGLRRVGQLPIGIGHWTLMGLILELVHPTPGQSLDVSGVQAPLWMKVELKKRLPTIPTWFKALRK